MAQIEQRLLAAEAAAQQAKDAVVGQADVAKLERERALAARTEAEQANKNLDSARCRLLPALIHSMLLPCKSQYCQQLTSDNVCKLAVID